MFIVSFFIINLNIITLQLLAYFLSFREFQFPLKIENALVPFEPVVRFYNVESMVILAHNTIMLRRAYVSSRKREIVVVVLNTHSTWK